MIRNRNNIPQLTAEFLVNMDLFVEKKQIEEKNNMDLHILKQKVIKILWIPRNSSAEEIRLLWKVKLKKEDIYNITNKRVLEILLDLNKNNEANI